MSRDKINCNVMHYDLYIFEDASDSTTDTSKKDENLRKVNKEEREPTSCKYVFFPYLTN